MRTFGWFIHFWAYLVAVVPAYFKARRLERRGDIAAHDALTRRVVGKWARSMLRTAGATVTVSGLEHMPPQAAVYVCNHLGYFDIPLVLGYLGADTKPMLAKQEIRKIPIVRSWMTQLHCVFVDRHNPKQSVQALGEAAQWVGKGYSMVVFPEGTRSLDGLVGEFKGGAFRIAQKAGTAVVPCCITGTGNLMPPGRLRIRPAAVTLQVLAPIETEGFTREDWKALPARCEAAIRQAVGQEAPHAD